LLITPLLKPGTPLFFGLLCPCSKPENQRDAAGLRLGCSPAGVLLAGLILALQDNFLQLNFKYQRCEFLAWSFMKKLLLQ